MLRPRTPERTPSPLLLSLLAVCCAVCAPRGAESNHAEGERPPPTTRTLQGAPRHQSAWKEVERLVDEQKMEAASAQVAKIRAEAQKAGDEIDWARALVREVQLRTALHGYETAVRFLRTETWPKGPTATALLDLFYAHALTTYLRSYGWEIRQRERIESKGPIDLKQWTAGQIYAEAQRAYADVWRRRSDLGKLPAGALGDALVTNTYPDDVRGTLRDTVGYLFVQLLADTSHWTPEHSAETAQLDLQALTTGDFTRSTRLDPGDASIHPLIRMGAILDDLEAWHTAERRPGGQLEARLERLRRLRASYSERADRATLRGDLERRLPAFRQHPWWAMGQAELAEAVRDDLGEYVRARDLAREGEQAFGGTFGGQRSAHVRAQLELPGMQLQGMKVDGAQKRSLQLLHKNVERVYFRAYRLDIDRALGSASPDGYQLLPHYQLLKNLIASQQPVTSWTVQLPATPDLKQHATYVTPPRLALGQYVLVASVKPDFAGSSNVLVADFLAISDHVLTEHQMPDGGIATRVLSGASGESVAKATVELWQSSWSSGKPRTRKVESKKTDADGEAVFSPMGEPSGLFFVVRKGDDVLLDPDQRWMGRPGTPGEQTSTLVYTDRSIYRPGQTLKFKAVAYRGLHQKADWHVLADTAITVRLRDANGQEVAKKELRTNSFGSAAGELAIPNGRLLGGWRLDTTLGGGAAVRVEEYKRPTFEVAVKDPEGVLRLGQASTLTGEAKYYFGMPVTSGQVKWRITREPVYPWWWGWDSWWMPPAPTAARVVAQGAAAIDAQGLFRVKFTPAAEERPGASTKGVSYRFRLAADLTDEGGETRSAERSFRIGHTSIEAGISSETQFIVRGQKATLDVRRTSLDGVARPGSGHYRILALEAPKHAVVPSELARPVPTDPAARREYDKAYRTPGDALRPRWETPQGLDQQLHAWPDGAERASGELQHDKDGKATIALPALAPGGYRVRYTTKDEAGNPAETWKHVVVVGGQHTPLPVPSLLLVERSSVEVGGKARVFVHSGLPQQPLTLDVYRDNRRIDRKRITGSQLVELPIKADDRGGLGLVLTAERDHQWLSQQSSVFVPWSDRELAVSFSTFRDKLRPGAKETLRVDIKTKGGKRLEAGAAEVLAYMYDRSLDAFAPHSPPSTMSLWPWRGQSPYSRVHLGAAWSEWLVSDLWHLPGCASPRADQLGGESGYGIGGLGRGAMRSRNGHPMAQAATAMPAPAAPPPPEEGRMARGEAKDDAPAAKRPAGGLLAKNEKGADRDADGIVDRRDGDEAQGGQAGKPVQLRSNFAETAFFAPQLLYGKDGVTVEFQVPDSVTSWAVWAHALTRDLRGGSVHKDTRSVKDLMVRPYMPRFFREGDRADLKVVVNNASDKPLSGTLTLDILDPDTQKSLAGTFGITNTSRGFSAPAGGSATLSFPMVAPKRVGVVAFRAIAKAGDVSDGELRPLPVLPSRLHLAESRFVTLKDAAKRTMRFDDLAKNDDPTRTNEKLVVTIDGQLFYSVLRALPYLLDYPYECVEQTMNRFLSAGIVSSVFRDHPSVAQMAKELAKRETVLERFDAPDPNRKMTLEESPWLVEAQGGDAHGLPVKRILDPAVAKAERDTALSKLEKMQTTSGAFPWFPGGPPSTYMTLYLLHGFARAVEFKIDLPKPMVQRAWGYVDRQLRDDLERMMGLGCCWEFLTHVNYVASAYPDSSWLGNAMPKELRTRILDFSFAHWKQHSPYLKAYLALTLKRMGRPKDARLVFDSILDSAKSSPDLGTYWAAEDRSWLWYNDTVETHAFVLYAMLELDPQSKLLDGVAQWLLLDKKLGHWKSTKATAEAIYALTHYSKRAGTLGIREEATVSIGPDRTQLVFEPSKADGKRQIVVPGEKVTPAHANVTVEKPTRGFMFASATWHYATDRLPKEERGDFFNVSRKYYKRVLKGTQWTLEPLTEGAAIAVGDEVEVQLSLRTKHQAEYVHLRDPRGAGFEPSSNVSKWKWDLGISWYEEIRDSGTNFFFERLPVGEYAFKYRIRASMAGTFRVGSATVQCMYAPEFTAFSAGHLLTIK